jgi:mono/diheme cytochrome c family protein
MSSNSKIVPLVTLVFLTFCFILASPYRLLTSSGQANSSSKSDADTASLFDSKCAKCHGKDGRAKTMVGKMKHARDFTDPKWQADASDERLINSITNGKKSMPAFGKALSESQISGLAAYVRNFRNSSGQ